MDTTLIINPGSSSKKYGFFHGDREVLSVLFEHTESGFAKCVQVGSERRRCEDATEYTFHTALEETLRIGVEEGAILTQANITLVGVRIVAPGTYFTKHRKIDAGYIEYLEALERIAPLHIPHIKNEIHVVRDLLPRVPIVGVSDSAFHANIPPHAHEYSIPEEDAKKSDLYRFGYHGISVGSIVRKIVRELGSVPARTLVAHVGSGVSVTALRDGVSIDTTMGFAPGSGLMMGTRSGDLDSGALLHLMQAKGMSAGEAEAYIQKSGGFRAMLGENDLRIALDRTMRGDQTAIRATRMFIYQIQKAIGALSVPLQGIDLIVLTATAAERNPFVRSEILKSLAHLGIVLDSEKNEACAGQEGEITTVGSPARAYVLHTDEMGEIARIAHEVIQ